MSHNHFTSNPTSEALTAVPAAKRLDTILASNPWMAPESIADVCYRIQTSNANFQSKESKLVGLADKVNQAVQPHAACHKGCSHCCSMVTLIYRYEAVRLAQVSGRMMVDLPFRPHDAVLLAGAKVNGKLCPFVVGGCCSVYEQRPMICRLHHSLNDDPKDCIVSLEARGMAPVSMYDPDYVEVPYHELVRSRTPAEPWGAITEFFPD